MQWRSASELGQKYATQNYPSHGTQIGTLHGPPIKPPSPPGGGGAAGLVGDLWWQGVALDDGDAQAVATSQVLHRELDLAELR